MLNKKEKNILFVLDWVELLLTTVTVVLLTLLFRYDTSMLRYLFLVGDFFYIYSFSKLLTNLEKKIQENRITKSKSVCNKALNRKVSI